jgi:protein dopey
MLTTPSARQTSLNFLARRLPKLNGNDGVHLLTFLFSLVLIGIVDISHIIGRDTGLMIRAYAAVLEDDNLLVRRGALDLLEQTLHVDSQPLRQYVPSVYR